jgi:hypothetical protein
MSLFFSTGVIAASGLAATSDFDFITSTTFSAQSSVSIDNCFSADYNNYLIMRNLSATLANQGITIRLRASGSDDSGTNYRRQYIFASSTTITPSRSTGATGFAAGLGQTETSSFGFSMTLIHNPFNAARTTTWNNQSYDAGGNIELASMVWGHDLTTSYDGFTALVPSGTMTGSLYVYGWKV